MESRRPREAMPKKGKIQGELHMSPEGSPGVFGRGLLCVPARIQPCQGGNR